MNRVAAYALPLVAASLVLPASAATVTIDFETVTSFASIEQHYNGGTDGAGAAGPSLGTVFGGDLIGLKNDATGTFFSNAPSPLGVMTVVGTQATAMNVADGFADFSLYYASDEAVANAVQIWSGLNGTGTLIRSLSLAANATANGCTSSPFCNFSFLSAGYFGGERARSVTFGNAAFVAVFDNFAFTVPEPSSAALVALALTGLVLRRRRAPR